MGITHWQLANSETIDDLLADLLDVLAAFFAQQLKLSTRTS